MEEKHLISVTMNLQELQNYSLSSEKLTKNKALTGINQPSFIAKSMSSMVDTLIVTLIRVCIGMVVGAIFYTIKLKEIMPTINFQSPTLMQDLTQSGFLFYFGLIIIITILLGGMYFVLFISSKYSATLGQMLFDIKVVDRKTFQKISFFRSLVRYIAYLVPIALILLIIQKYLKQELDIIFLAICAIVFLWYDFGMFLKIKIGMPDLLAKTILTSTKITKKKAKFKIPFFK